MNHHRKRLMASLMVLGLTICTAMTVLAKEKTQHQIASGSDAEKPVCDKLQHINPSTKDIASPSDIMMLSTDGETFGFSIRKTGVDGPLNDEATFRLYRTYDDAVANRNAIYFMADDSYETYTACGSEGCDYGSIWGSDIYAGLAEVKGLPNETYYLAEVMAPEGYEKIRYILEIMLEDDGSVYYREMPHGTDFTQADDGLLTIENLAILGMPGTGGSGNTLFYMTGVGFILAALFILCRCIKRR